MFEEYLKNKHSETYEGLDDDMEGGFEDWIAGLDPQEWIDLAQDWHDSVGILE